MANLSYDVLEPPFKGIDTETAPHRLERGYGVDLVNFIPGPDHIIRPRSGLHDPSNNTFAVNTNIDALWWARGNSAGSAWLVDQSSLTTYVVNLLTGTVTTFVVGSSGVLPSDTHVNIGSTAYGQSLLGFLLRWDGSTTATVYANAGENFSAITYWQNRLWVIGGKAAGGLSPENTLRWSDQVFDGTALPDTVAAWQDDVSGLTNRIQWARPFNDLVGASNTSGLIRLPSGLVVFDDLQVDFARGSTPTNLTVQYNVTSHTPVNRACALEYNQGMLFLSYSGLYFWDGSQELELSRAVRRDLQEAITEGTPSITQVGREHILVNSYNTATTTSKTWLFNLAARTWTRLEFPFPARAMSSAVTKLGNASGALNSGIVFDGRKVWGLYALLDESNDYWSEDDDGPSSFPITATARYRHLYFDTPATATHVHRVSLDLAPKNGQDADYVLNLYEAGDDRTLLFTQTGSTDTGAGNPQRVIADVYEETNELEVELSITPNADDVQATEVRDFTVAHQPIYEQFTV